MSAVINAKIAEAQSILDAAKNNLSNAQTQVADYTDAVNTAQARADELTQLNADVDAEIAASQPAAPAADEAPAAEQAPE